MNLRESLERWQDGQDQPIEGREQYLSACGFVRGYAEAAGLRLATSTSGPTLRIHNLGADTRSALVLRREMRNERLLFVALRAQLDALPHWGPESDNWGPDPWAEGKNMNRDDA